MLYIGASIILTHSVFKFTDCVLPYINFPTKEPIFLNTDLDLIEPKVSAIELLPNEEIYVSCPGSRNYLVLSKCKNRLQHIDDYKKTLHFFNRNFTNFSVKPVGKSILCPRYNP